MPESDKSALKTELERLQKRCAALENTLHATVPDAAAALIRQIEPNAPVTHLAIPTFQSVPTESHDAVADGEAAEGRLLFDPDGTARYLGETSGATFLDYLKQFMLTLVPLTFRPESGDGSSFVASIGQYQTFDSRPLPNPNVDPLWLPAQSEMALMLKELRYFIQDGNGEFPSGGIYWWGDMSNLAVSKAGSASLNAVTTDDTFRHLAFHHVCFALASSIGHTSFQHSRLHTGEAYFKRARKLLGNPLDTVRFTLSDVPVLALMGFYLIELNRRDAAYMYVSLAVHIAIIHGAFRSCVDEASKRSFWTLYILDRWLSVLMGRPPAIADEAIRLSLPVETALMPPVAGLRAHIELARISGYIVCETFKIAPRNYKPGHSTENIDVALAMLDKWKSQLPIVLNISHDDVHLDTACCMLHMAQDQLVVLTTRPTFLAAVKQAVAERFIGRQWLIEQHSHGTHLRTCSAAAHRNLSLARRLWSSRKFLQAGLHFVFNAAVILLLDRIVHGTQAHLVGLGHAIPMQHIEEELHASEIQFAIHVFEQESRTGTNYPRDCCRVLQDLKALVDRYLSQSRASCQTGSIAGHDRDPSAVQIDPDPSSEAQLSQAFPSDGNDLYQELMTWVQSDGLQLRNGLLV